MLPALDLSSLLPFVLTAIALVFGSLLVVKKAASRYFVVDASFETGEGYDSRHRMSIGGGAGGEGGDAVCAACGMSGTKTCSRCKSVRYCSPECQSKHWEEHKLKCKQMRSSDKVDSVSSGGGAYRRRKSSGFGSISLVPARGSCKELQEPKKILFPYDEFVKLFNWDKPGFPPCGLLNCGNSCFANVVLQCLACTRPLTAYLLEKDHSRLCIRKQEDWCFLCELQAHIQRSSQSRQPFSPINILSRIPKIGGNLGYGSQEDAHEFMRFAIDTMQSICLDEHGGEKVLDPSTQETTLIQHIFGGHLQSQVKCTKCNMISNRYENMMDLTVEIHGDAESLEECLEQFTVKEWLDGDNMYKCDGCNGYVKAWKRLTVHQAPNILTIALKRFQSGRFGKLNKRVTFPEELNLSPYMSEDRDGINLYTLYAVVVHVDMLNASFFGHYICYTKDYYGRWYRIDDCKVTIVDVEEVLSQGAYMLLYNRRTPRKEPFVKPMEPARKKHLASRDIDLSSVSKGENVYSNTASLHSDIGSESNIDLFSLSSNAGSESDISLRETGHDRLKDTKTDTIKAKEILELQVPTEVNPMLLDKDSGDPDTNEFQLKPLGPTVCEGESSSQPSRIQEDNAAVFLTDSNSLSSPTPPSFEVQDMECEEPIGCEEEGSSQHCHIQEDAAAVSETDANLFSSTPPSAEVQDMECEEPFSTNASNFNIKENGSAGTTEVHHLSGHALDGSDVVPSMAVTSSNASMTAYSSTEPESSDGSECKREPVIVEEHYPLNSTNGVGKLTNVSCSSGETKSLPSILENGSIGKPKPILSPGFLDRSTGEKSGEKSGDKEKRTPPGKQKASTYSIANGYTNGQRELKKDDDGAATCDLPSERGRSTTSDSNMAFISRGFLNRPYSKSKSAAGLENGQANGTVPTKVASGRYCSSENSGITTEVAVSNRENGCSVSKKNVALRLEDKDITRIPDCQAKLTNGTFSQDGHAKFGEFNGMASANHVVGGCCNGK